MNAPVSPFVQAAPAPLPPEKFRDPDVTAKGERRARVALQGLQTLWFNTGTLCNLTCLNCYIESSPTNDALVYLTAAEVEACLAEIAALGLPTREIGFTGGEPFMNPDAARMIEASLERGFDVLVLTNAMRPMRKVEDRLLDLRRRFGERMTLRVSLDHHGRELHEAERGPGTWEKALSGLCWLAGNDFRVAVAGRRAPGETEAQARAGFAGLFSRLGVGIDASDPAELVLFPEMDPRKDVPEITEDCWGILGKSPSQVMCSSSRMVVRRRGEPGPRVVACTLLPYDAGFDLGATLAEASREVALNHPFCAQFCVLGGASCSAA